MGITKTELTNIIEKLKQSPCKNADKWEVVNQELNAVSEKLGGAIHHLGNAVSVLKATNDKRYVFTVGLLTQYLDTLTKFTKTVRKVTKNTKVYQVNAEG